MGQTYLTRKWTVWKAAVLITGLMVFVVATGHAQSQEGQTLGDLARQQKQKQHEKAAKAAKDAKDGADTKAKKVITNEDVPERPDLSPDAASGGEGEGGHSESIQSATMPSGHSPEEWKAAILAQKNAVSTLQQHLDKLNASIHVVEANRYTNGVQYNQHQAQKQEAAKRLQSQLDEEKKKLEDMQEAARKAGMGNGIYDP